MNRFVLMLSVVLVLPALAGPKKSIPPRKRIRTMVDVCSRGGWDPPPSTKDQVWLFERKAPELPSLVQAPTTFEPAARLTE